MKHLLLLLLMLFASANLYAGIEVHTFADPQQEADYKQLINELRCLVCQNQNIADSNADLAKDLRREIYGMISNGQSRDQIVTFMTDRYGDFVMYRPPFKTSTAVLWIGPFVLLGLGMIGLLLFIRNRKNIPVSDETSESDHARAIGILDGDLLEDEKKSNNS